MTYAQKDKTDGNSIVSIGIVLFVSILLISLPSGQAQQIPPPDESHASHPIGVCGTKHFEPRLEFCDARDNQVYRYVKIGTQTWMAENLNFGTMVPGSEDQTNPGQKYCLFDQAEKCGALYQWAEAMGIESSFNAKVANLKGRVQGICPSGWHLPNSAEWDTLLSFVDKEQGRDNEAISLMSYAQNDDFKWKTNTDPDSMMPKNLYGFSLEAYGIRVLKGSCPVGSPNEYYFCNAHDRSFFWTSDDATSNNDPKVAADYVFTEDVAQASNESRMPDMSKTTEIEKAEMKKMDAMMKERDANKTEAQKRYKNAQKYQGMSIRCVKD
jgi:uncharacterized protein (TIGR02145 family)